MSSDWPKVKLADYCEKIGSGATPRGGSKVYLDSGEISLVRSQNVYNHGFDYDGLVYIDEEAAEKLSNVELEENDVLINITGDSVARVCMVPNDVLPARVNQHVSILRPKNDSLDPQFLRYSLVNYENQYKLLAIASAGGTRNAITKGHLEDFEISLPSLDYQKKVSEILSILDQKIHLNQQTNETLEAMAQAIFKSWFVDFDPVRAKIEAKSAGRDPNRAAMAAIAGISLEQDWDEIEAALDQKLARMSEAQQQQLTHTAQLFPDELLESEIGEVPKGWNVKSIDSLTKKVSKGTTPSRKARANADDEPSIKFLKVKDVDEKGVIDRSDLSLISKSIHLNQLKRSILHENDILFSIAGTIGRVTFIDEDLENSNCNQALAFIRLKDAQKHFNLFLLNLKSKRIQDKALSLIVQGVQANLSLTNIKEFEIVVPEDELLAIWNSIISELLNMIKSKRQENRSLSELRDTLLPKLISGKLQI